MYTLRSRRFKIKRFPPDDLSIKKKDERNWSLLGSTCAMASFRCRRSISKSQASAADTDKLGSER